jgi:hypothetical protein
MNWNGQREIVNHLIAKRSDPANGSRLQTDFNAKRRAKVQSAINTRPVFMPLQFTLPAAGQVSGVRDTTESVNYDVIITGIKTDVQTRDIIIRRTEDEKPVAYVGEEQSLYLRTDEIAGLSATTGGGQIGTFYLPSPIILPAGNRMTVEMFKTDVTATSEIQNIVLIGFRVFHKAYGVELIDTSEDARITQLIKMREVPRVVFLKQLIEFDSAVAGGIARNLYTPQVEEPLLVRGVRTTLRQSNIEISIQGEPKWTTKPTPIWGVCGEDETIHDNYQWFSRPIFLHSKNTIEIERITNSIDGTNIDPQSTGTITWICETV